MLTELNADILEHAFDDLGQMARDNGLICEIAVYGGASIMLATDIRGVTRDVDSAFLKEAPFIDQAVQVISRKRGLPDDWLNQSIAHMVTGRIGPTAKLTLFNEYPRDHGVPGLRVLLPTPEYILAMKLIISGRTEPHKDESDRKDIIGLMRITKIRDKTKMMDLVKHFFPSAIGTGERIKAKIEDAIKAEKDSRSHDSDAKTWNAQGSRAPGSGR
jgi:hypothetical protein